MSQTFDPYYSWLGIRPDERPVNHYRLLGVSLWESDADVIANAADQRMSFLKTFQTGPHSRLSQDLLNETAKARLCLLNAAKKSQYDAELKSALEPTVTYVADDAPTPLGDAKSKKYFFARDDQTYGPFTSEEMRQFAREGTLLPDDQVIKQGHGDWTAASKLAGLASVFKEAGAKSLPTARVVPAAEVAEQAAAAFPDAAPQFATVDFDPSRSAARKPKRNSGTSMALVGLAIAVLALVGIVAATKISRDNAERQLVAVGGNTQPPAADNKPATTAETSPTVEPTADEPADESTSDESATAEAEAAEPGASEPAATAVASSDPRKPPRKPATSKTDDASNHSGDDAPDHSGEDAPDHSGEDAADHSDASRQNEDDAPTTDGDATPDSRPTTPPDRKPPSEDTDRSTAESEQAAVATEEADDRLPVPDQASQDEALAAAKELFADDYSDAKTTQARRKLADKLLGVAKETNDDPNSRFVLLSQAIEMAVAGGDFDLALQAVDELEAEFAIDGLDRRVEVLTAVAKDLPKDKTESFVEKLLEVVHHLVRADKFESAGRLLKLAAARAKRDKATELVARVVRLEKFTSASSARFAGAQGARSTLEANPQDAEANRVLGEYLILIKADWAAGCQHLSRGNDAELKAAATAELARPTTADDQIALGDAWWTLAGNYQDSEKESLQRRASGWYTKGVGNLSGITKVRVEKRIAEVESNTEAPPALATTTPPAKVGPIGPKQFSQPMQRAWATFFNSANWNSLLSSQEGFQQYWQQSNNGGTVFYDPRNRSLRINSAGVLGGILVEGPWATFSCDFDLMQFGSRDANGKVGQFEIVVNDVAIPIGEHLQAGLNSFAFTFDPQTRVFTYGVVNGSNLMFYQHQLIVPRRAVKAWSNRFSLQLRTDANPLSMSIRRAQITPDAIPAELKAEFK
jgi:hypothetical protein